MANLTSPRWLTGAGPSHRVGNMRRACPHHRACWQAEGEDTPLLSAIFPIYSTCLSFARKRGSSDTPSPPCASRPRAPLSPSLSSIPPA
jgi:hypothetical protein